MFYFLFQQTYPYSCRNTYFPLIFYCTLYMSLYLSLYNDFLHFLAHSIGKKILLFPYTMQEKDILWHSQLIHHNFFLNLLLFFCDYFFQFFSLVFPLLHCKNYLFLYRLDYFLHFIPHSKKVELLKYPTFILFITCILSPCMLLLFWHHIHTLLLCHIFV